jgi:hypothetical protein
VIMDNLFKNFKVGTRFDLKGSTQGRTRVKSWQSRSDVDIAVALKDNDFIHYVGKLLITQSLKPGSQDLHKILNADSNFLRSVEIIDYSLLLGEITTPLDELKEQIDAEPELGRGVYCTEN